MSGDTITVKVLWGSKSSGGKWGRRAIAEIKAHADVTYDPDTKTWTLPGDIELSNRTWEYLEVIS